MVVATVKEMKPKKCVIIGAGGMLGHALQEVFPEAHRSGRANIDITDEDAVFRGLTELSPHIVINAAGYTDVDGCEDNREYAHSVNGRGPGYIAHACAECDAVLVHYSTDYVFDGLKPEYVETDEPHPINAYGESKLLGEKNIRKNIDNFRLIRTSWLFGAYGKNFVDTILALSNQIPLVRVVNDQVGKPTYSVDLARKTREIITCEPGIYHITNDGQCSWYEFASAFIQNAVPCTTAEFPKKAKRPAYSVLTNTKTAPLRHWKDAVRDYIQRKGGNYL